MASPAVALLNSWFAWTACPLIVSAPMRTISGSSLTAAVSNAAGLGFFGAGYSLDDAVVMGDLDATPALLQHAEPSSATRAFGIGFLLFRSALPPALDATRRHRPAAAWFFAPTNSGQLQEWVRAFRHAAPWTKIFVQVSSVGEAQEVVGMGVDVLVAQGVADAGGHGRRGGGSIVSLVPEVKDLVQKLEREVPVLAAGGIMDGRGAAAALALGADGVVLGTRLVASDESQAPTGFRQLLVDTRDGGVNTVRTRVYDALRGTDFWPSEYGGRAVRNDSFRDHEGGMDESTNMLLYQTALESEDFSRLTAFAGTGIGLTHEILPAGEIVERVRQDARDILLHRAIELSGPSSEKAAGELVSGQKMEG